MFDQSDIPTLGGWIGITCRASEGHLVPDWNCQFLKFDECIVGDERPWTTRHMVAHLATEWMSTFPCMCERLEVENDWWSASERLHQLAADLGTAWVGRTVPQVA